MDAPDWWERDGAPAVALAPLGLLYGLATRMRLALVRPWRAPVPVVCVGNLVAGGAGKTPVALDIAGRLLAQGVRVHVLTRGYGGHGHGPRRVDAEHDGAAAVGDEALLLARTATTWTGRDRRRSAEAAIAAGAQVLVMDDGFQDPRLAKDLSLIVIDGSQGFGNGRLIPAGPLREGVRAGLARAEAVVILGADQAGVERSVARAGPAGLGVLKGRLVAGPGAAAIAGRTVVAFAGIGRPQKFFATLAGLGCRLAEARGFPDHHPYRDEELAALAERARGADALLVTTAKDAVRLSSAWRERVAVVSVGVAWEDPRVLDALLTKAMAG